MSIEEEKIADHADPSLEYKKESFVDELLLLLSQDPVSHFDKLVAAYEREIRNYLGKRLRNPEDVKDCVQESFANLLRALSNKEAEEILALRHIHHYCIDAAKSVFIKFNEKHDQRMKTEKPLEEVVTELASKSKGYIREAETEVLEAEKVEEAWKCVNLLTRDYRVVLYLSYHEERTSSEIAELLHWTDVHVRTQKSRGLIWLRNYMAVKDAFEVSADMAIREYAQTFLADRGKIVRLHFIDHYSPEKIAASLHWQEEAVKKCLFGVTDQIYHYLEVKSAFTEKASLDIQSISASYQLVVHAHFIERRPLEQIALNYSWSRKHAEKLLHRGIKLCHDRLKPPKGVAQNRSQE